jgi:hypothetical protein
MSYLHEYYPISRRYCAFLWSHALMTFANGNGVDVRQKGNSVLSDTQVVRSNF